MSRSPRHSLKNRPMCVLGATLFCAGLTSCVVPEQGFDPHNPATWGDPEFLEVNRDRKPDSALLEPIDEPFRLGVGDKIRLEISGHQESIDDAFVLPDGTIFFDLAGGVDAEGKTLTELTSDLQARLKKYYRSPIVSATLTEVNSRRVWVLGNVSSPGLYPLTRDMSLLDAISSGGGILTSRASGTTIQMADLSSSFIMREGKLLPVDFEALVLQGDTSQNIMLRPDDYIYLPSVTNQEVLVLGHVRRPRSVSYKENLGLVGAIAEAEGMMTGAYYQQVLVIRGSIQQPRVAVVNYDSIVKGKEWDISMRPGDIVWVPRSPWQKLEQYVDAVLGVVLRTIAANEGRRAAVGPDNAGTTETTIGVGQQSQAPIIVTPSIP